MTQGPLGGPRPFASDNKTVLVLAGIDGPEPPSDVLISLRESVSDSIYGDFEQFNFDTRSLDVNLTTKPNEQMTDEQKDAVGMRALHIQQYDIDTPFESITQSTINAIHNEVMEVLNSTGFNITGTRTTVV